MKGENSMYKLCLDFWKIPELLMCGQTLSKPDEAKQNKQI